VVGISSDANTSVKPILFPDIIDDPKLRDGYKGYDQFMLMEGQLIRRFPLYTTDSTTQVITPTGKMRQVMYTIRPGERGSLKFFVQRSYDYNKQ
jgi:hypothetical protein